MSATFCWIGGAWGIRRIYGYPGDGILGALGRAGDRFQFIQARHEEPVLLEAYTDPNVPPHITFEQAEAYLSALFGGDPEVRA